MLPASVLSEVPEPCEDSITSDEGAVAGLSLGLAEVVLMFVTGAIVSSWTPTVGSALIVTVTPLKGG